MNNKFFYYDADDNNDVNNTNTMNNPGTMNNPNNVITPSSMITPSDVLNANNANTPSTPSTAPTISTPPKGNNKKPIIIIAIITVVIVAGVAGVFLLTQNKKGGTYYCEEGYKLVGDICSVTITERPTYDLGCPEGYDYSGESHKCEKQVEEVSYYRYECGAGFVLNSDNKCEGDSPKSATREYVCTNGELNGKTCINKTKNNKVLICNNYCPEGLTPTEDKKICYKRANPDPVSGCPKTKGWTTESNGKCYYAEEASCNYSCPTGYVFENNSCFLVETKQADYILTCPEGTELFGSMCNIPTVKNPKTVYYCDDDAKLKPKNHTICLKTLYAEIGDVATCQKGYTLENDVCKKIETKPAKKK